MTRILFTTMPITGHVRPGLPIARELTRRGHHVVWTTGRAFARQVEGAGADYLPIPAALEPDGRGRPGRGGSGLRKLRRDVRRTFLGAVPAYLDHLGAVVREAEPDVVVADQGLVAGPLLAERLRIPRVIYTVSPLTLSSPETAPFGTGLPPSRTPVGRLRNRALNRLLRHVVFADSQREARRLRRRLGLPPLRGAFLDWGPQIADRYLHTTIAGFEYPRRSLPDSLEFVGAPLPGGVDAWSPPPWWEELAAARRQRRPVILVTQGTVATDPAALLLPAVEALAGQDVRLVATTGGADPESVLPFRVRPANVRLEAFVPFTELLPHVDVMVTNGGYGGVQTALAHGVPIVAAGRSEDKMEVNARVAWSGAGVSLRTDRPAPDRIAAAVHAVLTEPSYREAARRLRDGYARHDAAGRAADLVLAAASSGRLTRGSTPPRC
jgi:MGT family glycosyltransferase